MFADPYPEQRFYLRSDNASFVKKGVMGHSVSAGSTHPDYHTPRDEPKNINYPKLTRMTQWMYMTGWIVGNAAKRPGLDPGFVLR